MDRADWLAERCAAYLGRDRVLGWLATAGLAVEDEGHTPADGWSYRHFLLRRPS